VEVGSGSALLLTLYHVTMPSHFFSPLSQHHTLLIRHNQYNDLLYILQCIIKSAIMVAHRLIIASWLLLSSRISATALPSIYALQDSSDASTCSGKTQGSTFTYVSSGTTYDILCGQDYYGGDLRNIRVDTFSAYLTECSGDPACVAVAFETAHAISRTRSLLHFQTAMSGQPRSQMRRA
jgi:hypothetical protein